MSANTVHISKNHNLTWISRDYKYNTAVQSWVDKFQQSAN